MFARVIADRYARATLHDCPDLASIERAKSDLGVLGDAYRAHASLRRFLLDPKMPVEIKRQILEKGFKDRLSPTVLHLLYILLKKHRQAILPEIADRYSELVDTVRGVEVAEIVTAVSLSPAEREALVGSVQRFSTRKVEVRMSVDPGILGGVIVRMGDRVIDGTLKRRFEEIRRTMLAARLPVMIAEEG